MIPDASDRRITVGNQEFADSLRRMLIVAREDANRVVLRGQGDVLIITAESSEVGHEERLPATLEEKPEIAAQRALSAGSAAGDPEENVVLELSQPLSPARSSPRAR